MPFRRHTVIAHGWDKEKKKGWMQFRCNRCGYVYKMWMYDKVYRNIPPTKPGGKPRRVKMPYTEYQLNFLASWWGPKGNPVNDGCSVSSCRGCIPAK